MGARWHTNRGNVKENREEEEGKRRTQKKKYNSLLLLCFFTIQNTTRNAPSHFSHPLALNTTMTSAPPLPTSTLVDIGEEARPALLHWKDRFKEVLLPCSNPSFLMM
jgi:hypothetical protein